jgi:hypothetical protein
MNIEIIKNEKMENKINNRKKLRFKVNCVFSSRCLDFMEPNASTLDLIDELYLNANESKCCLSLDEIKYKNCSFINLYAKYFEPNFDQSFKSVGYLIEAYRLNNNNSSSRVG